MIDIGHGLTRGVVLAALVLLAACAGDDAGPNLPERPPPPPVRSVEGMSLAEMMALGESFVAAGEPRAAIAIFDRAAEEAPQDPAPLLKMGRLFLDAGDVDVAERVYRQALTRSPDSTSAHLALAQIEILHGAPDDALARLNTLEGLAGEQARDAANLRGLAHDLDGRHESAQLAYAKALAIAPESAGAMTNLALSLALSGEMAAARDILQELAETDGGRSRALENLALVHALSGQQAAAMRTAMEAVDADFARQNSAFYSRLAALDRGERARAVLLGELPSDSPQATGEGAEMASAARPTPQPEVQEARPAPVAQPQPSAQPKPEPEQEQPLRSPPQAEPPEADPAGEETDPAAETESAESSAAVAVPDATGAGASDAPEYYLQLGSFRDAPRVRRHWGSLSDAGLAADLSGFAAPVPGEGGMMRLLGGPLRGYSRASARCAEIRAAGHACLVRVAPDQMEPLDAGD